MVHPRDSEQPIEVAQLPVRVGLIETLHRVVVEHRVARADQLVGPADVVQQLPVVRRPGERGQVRARCLRGASEQWNAWHATRTLRRRTTAWPGSMPSAIAMSSTSYW